MRPTRTSTRCPPIGTDSATPPWPAAVGGVNPGNSDIGTDAVAAPRASAAGAQPDPEHDRDVVFVGSGAVADHRGGLLGHVRWAGHGVRA